MIKLVKSNIRKDRAVFTAFLMIIILSTLLLSIGLFIKKYDAQYDEKKEWAGIGDVELFATGNSDEVSEVINGISDVKEYRLSDIIRSEEASLSSEERKYEESRSDVVLHSVESVHISHCKFMERDDSFPGPKVYLNLYFATSNGFKPGDKITIEVPALETKEYTVAGIYEDVQQGNTFSWCSVALDPESFDAQRKLAEDAAKLDIAYIAQTEIVASFVQGVIHDDGLQTIISALYEKDIPTYGFTIKLAKAGYVSVTNILAAFTTVFALVAMIVCFVMIIFTINNNIDRDVRNIGALRAVGHTNRQIQTALLLEYLVIGTVGCCTGTALAYILMPVIDKGIMRSVTGMYWENKAYPVMNIVVLVGLLLTMSLVVFLATRRIRNLHPATALRFGLQSNSFKKNPLPLATTKGKLNPLLAAKSMLQNKVQNLIVAGVVVVVAFMTIFSGILLYNTRVDISKFQTIVEGDVPDGVVMVNTTDEAEISSIREDIAKIPGVSEAYGYEWHNISVEGKATYAFYTDHPEYLQCGVYEGQMYQEANEAVIGRLLAEKLDVKIGDEIEIECAGNKARFIVTGYQQSVINMGERVFISAEGLKRLGLQPEFSGVRIRVEDATEEAVDDVLSQAKEVLGESCTGVDNVYRYQRSGDNLIMFAATLLILLLIFVNIGIIFLVIKLLLKTVFIRKEKEFGIKKAVGFTSRQLRLQLALSLFPVSFIASIGGAILGFLLVNPLLSAVLSGFGIASADFLLVPALIFITVAVVGVLVFGMTYLMSGRMKKISAYQLMQE